MTVLMVADQQNSPLAYSYLKKLARQLEKAGQKVESYTEQLGDIETAIAKKRPRLVHIHYHPQAKKIRHVMRVCEAAGIAVVITFHEVLRVPPERAEHVRKCIARTRYAFFLTDSDRDSAVSINPRLAEASEVVRIPAPNDFPEAFLSKRECLLHHFAQGKAAGQRVLYLEEIEPGRGIEAVLEATRQFPAGLGLHLAGTVPPGQGGYAKFLTAMVKYEQLPVTLTISKRKQGKKQLCDWLEESLFAYIPGRCGAAEGMDGITEHHMLVPFLNAARTLVFSHAGRLTSPAMREMVHIVKKPGEIPRAIAAYRQTPAQLAAFLDRAAEHAGAFTWQDLARHAMASYKTVLSSQ